MFSEYAMEFTGSVDIWSTPEKTKLQPYSKQDHRVQRLAREVPTGRPRSESHSQSQAKLPWQMERSFSNYHRIPTLSGAPESRIRKNA